MISKIPGYTPQVNVFSGMILAMIVITGLIVGIFVYIITIQKTRSLWNNAGSGDTDQNHCMVSVLSNLPPSWYGDCFSFAGNRRSDFSLTSYLLFYPSWIAYSVLSLVISLMALLGGVISLPRLLKVDPITAIAE